MKIKLSILLSALFLLSACAGPNPNPGERTTDMAWSSGNFNRAYSVVAPRAERGEPWAQLRLGIFYENGWGVDQDYKKAEYWYKKAAAQKASGNWANGKLVGAVGGVVSPVPDVVMLRMLLGKDWFPAASFANTTNT